MQTFGTYEHEDHSRLEALWPRYYNLISQHTIEHPISSSKIETALGIRDTAVRDLLNYGLEYKDVLISSLGRGYYLPRTQSEAQKGMTHLHEREAALSKRIHLSSQLIPKLPGTYTPSVDESEVIDDYRDTDDIDSIADSFKFFE